MLRPSCAQCFTCPARLSTIHLPVGLNTSLSTLADQCRGRHRPLAYARGDTAMRNLSWPTTMHHLHRADKIAAHDQQP